MVRNPFIDPTSDREHFPDFGASIEVRRPRHDNEICSDGGGGGRSSDGGFDEEEGGRGGTDGEAFRLEWSIDTMAHMALIGDKDGMGLGLTPGRLTAQVEDEDIQHMKADAAQAERFWRKADIATAGSVVAPEKYRHDPPSTAITPNHGIKSSRRDVHSPFGGSGGGGGAGSGGIECMNTVSSAQEAAVRLESPLLHKFCRSSGQTIPFSLH